MQKKPDIELTPPARRAATKDVNERQIVIAKAKLEEAKNKLAIAKKNVEIARITKNRNQLSTWEIALDQAESDVASFAKKLKDFLTEQKSSFIRNGKRRLLRNALNLDAQFESKRFRKALIDEDVFSLGELDERHRLNMIWKFKNTPSESLSRKDRDRAISWLVSLFCENSDNRSLQLEDIGINSKATDYIDDFYKYKSKLDRKDINQYRDLSDLFLATKPFWGTLVNHRVDPRKIPGAKFFTSSEYGEVWSPTTPEASCALGKGTEWCTAKYAPDDYRNAFDKYEHLYIFFDNRDGKRYQFGVSVDDGRSYMNDEDDREFQNLEFMYLIGTLPLQVPRQYSLTKLPNNRYTLVDHFTLKFYKGNAIHRDDNLPAVIDRNMFSVNWFVDGIQTRFLRRYRKEVKQKNRVFGEDYGDWVNCLYKDKNGDGPYEKSAGLSKSEAAKLNSQILKDLGEYAIDYTKR